MFPSFEIATPRRSPTLITVCFFINSLSESSCPSMALFCYFRDSAGGCSSLPDVREAGMNSAAHHHLLSDTAASSLEDFRLPNHHVHRRHSFVTSETVPAVVKVCRMCVKPERTLPPIINCCRTLPPARLKTVCRFLSTPQQTASTTQPCRYP